MNRVSDACGLSGHIALKTFELATPRAHELDAILRHSRNTDPAFYEELVGELARICPTRSFETRNLVVQSGREVLARLLAGDTAYSGEINYGALGTSSAAPAAGDAQLGAEVARKLFARRRRTTTQIGFDFFYSKADTTGTYQEFGLFIDGTASADSGQLFNRALTGGWVKGAGDAMTVTITINVNAS